MGAEASGAHEPAGRTASEITNPAKAMRLWAMGWRVLGEMRALPLDDAARHRIERVYAESLRQLATILSPDLAEEVRAMTLTAEDGGPTADELRIMEARLVGWLDGLFEAIPILLAADEQRRRELPRTG